METEENPGGAPAPEPPADPMPPDPAPEAPAPAPGAPAGWAARTKAWIERTPRARWLVAAVPAAILLAVLAVFLPRFGKRAPTPVRAVPHYPPPISPPRAAPLPSVSSPPAAKPAPAKPAATPPAPASKTAEEAARELSAVLASKLASAIQAAQPAPSPPIETIYSAANLRDPFSKAGAAQSFKPKTFDPARDLALGDLALVGILRGPQLSEALFSDKRFGVHLVLRGGRLYYSGMGGKAPLRRGGARNVLGTSIPGVTGAIMSKQGVVLRRGIETRVFVLGAKVA